MSVMELDMPAAPHFYSLDSPLSEFKPKVHEEGTMGTGEGDRGDWEELTEKGSETGFRAVLCRRDSFPTYIAEMREKGRKEGRKKGKKKKTRVQDHPLVLRVTQRKV